MSAAHANQHGEEGELCDLYYRRQPHDHVPISAMNKTTKEFFKMTKSFSVGLSAALFSASVFAADAKLNNVPDPDSRQLLEMPAAAKSTLRIEMMERLQTLQQVMQAVASGKPQDAAQLAKAGIGTGVMMRHGKRPPEAIPRNYMPESMKPLSKQSHMLGDELSEALKSGDRAKIDGKLAEVLGNCVACHNLYRVN